MQDSRNFVNQSLQTMVSLKQGQLHYLQANLSLCLSTMTWTHTGERRYSLVTDPLTTETQVWSQVRPSVTCGRSSRTTGYSLRILISITAPTLHTCISFTYYQYTISVPKGIMSYNTTQSSVFHSLLRNGIMMEGAQLHRPATLPLFKHPQLITQCNATCPTAGLTWMHRLKSLIANQTRILESSCTWPSNYNDCITMAPMQLRKIYLIILQDEHLEHLSVHFDFYHLGIIGTLVSHVIQPWYMLEQGQ